jgi:hypothetical protein
MLIKVNTKNGALLYHTDLKNFYIKDGWDYIIFNDKRVINSKYVLKQIKGV